MPLPRATQSEGIALPREHQHDLIGPHRKQRREVARHPREPDEATPRSGIGRGVPLANGSPQAFAEQLPRQARHRSQRLAGSSRIRDLESQVGDLPGEIHEAEEQVDADEDSRVTEPVAGPVETSACDRVCRNEDPPAELFPEVERQPPGQDRAPDEELGDHHLHDHQPRESIHPSAPLDVEQAERIGELVDAADLRAGRKQAGQEDRRERRVVEDDVALVLVWEQTPEGGHPEEDLRRDEEVGIGRVPGRHERVCEEVEVDERPQLQEPEKDREVLEHRTQLLLPVARESGGHGSYSAPTWAPFSATERRITRTTNTNSTPIAAENQKTSKKASDSACRARACSRTPRAVWCDKAASPVCRRKNA